MLDLQAVEVECPSRLTRGCIDILAAVAEHIRETNIIPAGGVFENIIVGGDGYLTTVDCIRIRWRSLTVASRTGVFANKGLIRYKEQGPELNLMLPNPDKPKTWIVQTVARPEDPEFFDIIDDFCRPLVQSWNLVGD